MIKPVQSRSLLMIERVLDAAESVVTRKGIGSLTMDAVAAEAGVSKTRYITSVEGCAGRGARLAQAADV